MPAGSCAKAQAFARVCSLSSTGRPARTWFVIIRSAQPAAAITMSTRPGSFSFVGQLASLLVLAVCVWSPAAEPLQDQTQAAKDFVSLLSHGDFAGALQQCDGAMLAALPGAKLKEVWQSLTTQAGPFQKQLHARTEKMAGYDIVFVTSQFEKDKVDIKVVLNSKRQVAGLFFLPGTEPAAPPPYVRPEAFRDSEDCCVAEDLTGWKMAEAIDKPVGEVFKIINEITRQRADNPVNKVLQQGIICSLANHTVLIKQDGTEISIDDSGAPIKNSDGITTGVVLVFRDITERRKAEKVLRQMELRNKLLADILENASQPFGIGLPDGRLGIVNKAFCDLTGYTEEELKTMDWAKLLTPPEYNAMESEKLAELVKTGQPVRYQKEYIRKDNSRVPIELLVHLVRGEDGEAEYYYSFLTDITDRQKAEKALKESEEKYRKLVINIPDEVWFTDTNKNFTLVNPEILDEEEDDVADIAAEAIANRLEVYRTDGSLRPMEESPPLRALRGEYLRNQEEMTKTPVKGELRYRQVSAAPVKDNNGNIIGSVSVLRDVTDQRKAEEENQISLNRFYSVLSEMPMGILLVIEEGLIEFANQSFCDIYNIKESPLYLRNLTSLEVIEKIQNAYMNPEKSVARIMEILAQGEPVKGEDIQMIGGRTVLRDFVPLRMGGNKQGRLWIHRDITERKKAEEELRKRTAELEASNKELEAFSYSVSHDLRAPLRSIAGFSNALLEDYAEKLDEEGKQYLQKIETSSELMGQLMDDLLKLSRVTRSELNFGKVNLSDIAQSVVNELQQAEPKRKIKMSITPDMMVYGDRNLLSLVLQNLLSNAWKFTGKTVEPRIEMGTIEHNGKQTYFVSDNGSGFDMAYTNKLFQPFQRLHKASEFAGTGIGLATVQRIIRRHGGEIWAEGKVGEGATFYFTLS